MNRYQTKTFSHVAAGDMFMETKVDVPGRKVCGYFAAFGNKDADGDIIPKGAFTKSIQERGPQSGKPRILFLRDHDSSQVLGRVDVLQEDEKGLYFEAQIANTQLGSDTLELYKMGALTEHSIGYQTVKSRYDKEQKANVLEEIKLWEGSVVPWGSNENTPVVGFKALKDPGQVIDRLTELAKQSPTDEYRSKLTILAQQLKAEQEEALVHAGQPGDPPTDSVVEPQTEAELKAAIDALDKLNQALRRK